MLETFNRTSGLQSSSSTRSEAQSSDAGTVHQNFLSRVFRCFFGKSSEHADADDLLIRNMSSEALWIVFGLRMQLLMERLLLQSHNLFKHSAATVRILKLIIQLKYLLSSKLRDVSAEPILFLQIKYFQVTYTL